MERPRPQMSPRPPPTVGSTRLGTTTALRFEVVSWQVDRLSPGCRPFEVPAGFVRLCHIDQLALPVTPGRVTPVNQPHGREGVPCSWWVRLGVERLPGDRILERVTPSIIIAAKCPAVSRRVHMAAVEVHPVPQVH